ncbi:MAG: LysR family transcriptional regulator [Burkholderiaceae bacterium]|nr:LysR family transcriptional regulator [Burkholderiaceae bacterium]
MKLHQLRYFVCVADQGSVRSAAEHLGVSAAAVSQALRELERDVSAPLLKREVRGTIPTHFGHELLVHARLILGQVARAEEGLGQLRGLPGGTLSIGVTPWVSLSILPGALQRFRALRPNVRLDVSESLGSRHQGLHDGSLDIVIGMPPARPWSSSFFVRDLFVSGLAVVARQGHPLARCTSLRALAEQDWVVTMHHDTDEQTLFSLLRDHGVDPPPERMHAARSSMIAIGLLDAGDLLTVCPWPLVESPLLRHRVQALPIRDPLPDMTTSLVVRRGDALGNAAQLFIECFKEAMEAAVVSEDPALQRIMRSVEVLSLH